MVPADLYHYRGLKAISWSVLAVLIYPSSLMSGDFSKHGCFCEKVVVKDPSQWNTDETDEADFH
jgi:hypothetical protein